MSERERDQSHADKASDGLDNALGTEYILRIAGSHLYHDFVTAESYEALKRELAAANARLEKSCDDGRGDPEYPVCSRAFTAEAELARIGRLSARSAGTRTVEPVWLWGLLQENPRAEVIQFAVAMERKLKANDYKGRWDDCSRNYLLRRLRQEANELGRAVYGEKVNQQTVCDEAADVANFAMMIADVCAALPQMPALPTGTPRSATERAEGKP